MTEPRFVEETGPDVETAIKKGLERLGVQSKDVIVEVIEESSRGLFGIGGRPARVRLTLLAPPSPPPARKPAPPPPPSPEQKPAAAEPSAAAGTETTDEEDAPRKSRRRRRKPRSRRPDSVAEAGVAVASDSSDEPLVLKRTPPADDDEEARVSVETLQELLGKMGIQAQVEASYAEPADETEIGPLVLQITGKDLGMLIGRRGETLASLQYVTRLIVSRELQRRANLVVDVEHYKARREQRLHSLALRMAKQATQRNRTVKLEPMPAYERRIIHLALRDRTDVYTQSEGEGDSRKVTIVPVQNR